MATLNDAIPAQLGVGEWPVLAAGPFVVEWDGRAVAVGHTLRADDSLNVRWHDGGRWHWLEQSFLTGLAVTGETIGYVEADGRLVSFRPLTLADAQLIFPTPTQQTLPGLRAHLTRVWNAGRAL